MHKVYLSVLSLLLCTSLFNVVSVLREGARARELAASSDQLRSALTEARGEIEGLAVKVAALTAARETPKAPEPKTLPAAGRASLPRQRGGQTPTVVRSPVEDPRWKQIRSQLAEQDERINETRQELQRSGKELEGRLNSARDKLTTSIAKTHDDVVALQKRGERNYYEFQLSRSK
jgi:uncharacterized coiled-coil DUF342 family protein